MKIMNSLHSLFLIVNLVCLIITCISQNNTSSTILCGKIQIQTPFLSSNSSSPLKHMILCRSQKMYFRTSLGLFQISSINYTTKTLTITSSSSSKNFVSPSLLSSGFPSPPTPNSLLLFNCSSSQNHPNPSYIANCSDNLNSCLLINDTEKLDKGFDPKDLRCSHYSTVHRVSSNRDGYKLGLRISFDLPDHVPDICNQCEKSNGNCGVGLRCICHPQECKDKVISMAGSIKLYGNAVLFYIIIVLISFINLPYLI